MSTRFLRFASYLLISFVCATISLHITQALNSSQLIPGANVNMVSGTKWPDGDPYLQRQNEPSIAVSTRNPMHLMAAANDYRAVATPGDLEAKATGDSWLGLFKSFDGGLSWQSTLHPGYEPDNSEQGVASPLKAYKAAADPTLRAGTNGLFYLNGIAFNRGQNALGVVFVSRFIDLNNKEGVKFTEGKDPIKFIGTTVIETGTAGQFTDKPWLAIDRPRSGAAKSNLIIRDEDAPGGQVQQDFDCGNAYITYAIFLGETAKNARSKIMFAKSSDCGATWSKPSMVDESWRISQGSTIAVAPETGNIHLAWRQFKAGSEPDAIVVARSTDFGKRFSKAVEVAQIRDPFDQPTLSGPDLRAFRTNAFPSMAVDGNGRVYLAWSERNSSGMARVVLSTSADGLSWSKPQPVDDYQSPGRPWPGHQIMPSLTFAAGKLTVLWYDFRDDVWDPSLPVVADVIALEPIPIRHSIDVRVAEASPEASPGAAPIFGPSTRVSRYMTTAVPTGTSNGKIEWQLQQLQISAPNLPLFAGGNSPFIGDYVDIAPAPMFLPDGNGWRFNTKPDDPAVLHASWTDNRDVAPPADRNWLEYTPPTANGSNGCGNVDKTGIRNQNIYTARLSRGLVAGTLGNSKDLSADAKKQSTFAIFVQNETEGAKGYELNIENQPTGGKAFFKQNGDIDSLNVPSIPPYSGFVRTVYVTSSKPRATVTILVKEVNGSATGVESRIVLNPDPTNPTLLKALKPGEEIYSPIIESRVSFQWPLLLNEIGGKTVLNRDIYEDSDLLNPALLNPALLNPALLNPALLNPALLNPALLNPALLNPALLNPALLNPALLNPALLNPALLNPALLNPALLNPALLTAPLTDITWTVKNIGNTGSGYNFAPVSAAKLPTGQAQLLIYRAYKTPFDNNCQLTEEDVHYEILANIIDPAVLDPLNPALLNPALLNQALGVNSFKMAPEEKIFVTLRVLDTSGNGAYKPETVSGAVASQAPNSDGSFAAKADQTITFGPLGQKIYGDPSFPVGATASSGLPVSFSAQGNCTVLGSTVTITGAGSCTITASQEGNINYKAATPVSQPFSIAKANATISVTPYNVTYDGNAHTATGTATGVKGESLSGLDLSGTTHTNARTYTDTWTFAGNGNYNSASGTVVQVINKGSQTITFGALPNKNFGDPPFTASATATSGLPVSFSILSGPATIAGNTVTITGAGTVTVRASQDGNGNYNPASYVDQTFAVAKAAQTITFGALSNKNFGDPPFTVSATATSGLPVSFSILSGPAKIAGNTVTITGAGTVTVRASQDGNANYNSAPPVTQSFTVKPYTFIGFLSPLGPADTNTVYGPFTLGKALPIKWQLKNAQGAFINDLKTVVSLEAAINSDCKDAADGIPFTIYPLATGSSQLRYDTTNNQYIFNWDTTGLEKTCYNVLLNLNDGTNKSIIVQLK